MRVRCPRQQRVRRHDRGELAQQPSSECPSSRGEPTALVVGEAQPSGSDLFTQDTILFPKVVDDVALLLVEPAGECGQDELQWMRQRRHGSQPIEAEFIPLLRCRIDRVFGHHGLDKAGGAHSFEERSHHRVERSFAEKKPIGDLSGGVSVGKQPEHCAFRRSSL